MEYKKYRKLLAENIERTFTQWDSRKLISESELYTFLHTIKGTSDTIQLNDLTDFCEAHLEILSPDDGDEIPITSLKNFKKNIRLLVNGKLKEVRELNLPDLQGKRFDENTFVLIIDHDLEFVASTKELLEQLGAQVLVAMNGKQGVQRFYDMQPNIVMIEMDLPDMTGLEVFKTIKDTVQSNHVMSILLSSNGSNEIMSQTYDVGMMDYISKPLDLKLFLPYLFNRDTLRKGISESITTDGLTGIGNRKRLNEILDYFERKTQRLHTPFSVIMIDLDHFKKVNDTYGHHKGDEVLKAFSQVAREQKRETDYVFRYGGEEFVVIVSGNEQEAYKLVERMHDAFNLLVFQEQARSFSVTFSAGIAEYNGELDSLLIEADRALYQAKRTGRNRTVTFDSNDVFVKRKLQVIIVDDDLLIRSMLQEELTHWEIPEIEMFVSVYEDGITFLDADWYDPNINHIILLDGIMPGMDGLEVLERLKHVQGTSNVLVSMMTARKSEGDIKSALWLGADDYIMKPFQTDEVLSRIQSLASRIF